MLSSVNLTQPLRLMAEFTLVQPDKSCRWSGLQQQELPYSQDLNEVGGLLIYVCCVHLNITNITGVILENYQLIDIILFLYESLSFVVF